METPAASTDRVYQGLQAIFSTTPGHLREYPRDKYIYSETDHLVADEIVAVKFMQLRNLRGYNLVLTPKAGQASQLWPDLPYYALRLEGSYTRYGLDGPQACWVDLAMAHAMRVVMDEVTPAARWTVRAGFPADNLRFSFHKLS